jgi:hypothetical protein
MLLLIFLLDNSTIDVSATYNTSLATIDCITPSGIVFYRPSFKFCFFNETRSHSYIPSFFLYLGDNR